MVFRKQLNEEGDYKDVSNVRWEILSCERTESMEWYDTGEVDEEGNPIMAQRVVINKGWDAFESLEEAASYYGLTYDTFNPEEELDNQEEID